MKNIYLFLLIIFIAISCKFKNKEKELKGSIEIDGSSTVFLITEQIANEFERLYPNVEINIEVSGTGGGFKKFCKGKTDINNASRKINEIEKIVCDSNNIEFIEIPVGYDGIAVVANIENDWLDYLSLSELQLIWNSKSEKIITNWSQIRKNWPDKKISLFGAGEESGTYDFFIEKVLGKKGKIRKDYTASEDDNIIVEGIASDKYSLGFFGLAYYHENVNKLKIIPIKNDTTNITFLPDIETIKNNKYIFSRTLYLYVNKASLQQTVLKEFIKFYLSQAAKICKQVGYIPLDDKVYNEYLNYFSSN